MAADHRFKRPESVLVVVYTRDAEVLLLKRSDHPEFWQSVTGSLQWNETPPAAARRELQEETGLGPVQGLVDHQRTFTFDILARWRHRFGPGVTRNREHVFSLALAACEPVTIDPREHCDYRWLPRDEAAVEVWSWSNRRAILDIVPE